MGKFLTQFDEAIRLSLPGGVGDFGKGGFGRYHEINATTTRDPLYQRAKPSFEAIALNRVAASPRESKSDARLTQTALPPTYGKSGEGKNSSVPKHRLDIALGHRPAHRSPYLLWAAPANLLRPFARLAEITARPPTVFMRLRNPVARILLILLG